MHWFSRRKAMLIHLATKRKEILSYDHHPHRMHRRRPRQRTLCVLWQREHVAELYRVRPVAVNEELSFTLRDAVNLVGMVRAYLQEAK